ncbi:MAG: DUF1015 domain-containing protein [Bryobacteraceae bacterium]
MATIKPFEAFRYSAKAGDPAALVTQPYDKISPAMQARYLAASPYNLVRIILGERRASDTESDNVYTRAAGYLNDWIRDGVLARDLAPGFYAYFQEFTVPDSGERMTRKGFIGLGLVEDYSAGVVFRHEQTLSGPKKDRLELIRHTRANFGQIFMLYPDDEGAIDRLLDAAAERSAPVIDVADEDRTVHRVWPVSDLEIVEHIQTLMQPKKLLIADGHHRYETAIAYRNENPENPAARFAMMTFVNMHSPGLRILATHRVLRGLPKFDALRFFEKAVNVGWSVGASGSVDALKRRMAEKDPHRVQIGVLAEDEAWLMKRTRKPGEMDVPILHDILGRLLGITDEAVREEKYITYVRGINAAAAEVYQRGAQVAFLLDPTPIDEMARIAFGGGVMPQKSTDFYPKLLSGLTIYKL